MRKIYLLLLLPLLLLGCGGYHFPAPELRAQKASCVAGDYAACAEIGHYSRQLLNAQGY